MCGNGGKKEVFAQGLEASLSGRWSFVEEFGLLWSVVKEVFCLAHLPVQWGKVRGGVAVERMATSYVRGRGDEMEGLAQTERMAGDIIAAVRRP